MKIVYNDGEKERLKEGYENLSLHIFDDNNPDKIYSISFKVTNASLAQYILVDMLHNKLEDFDLGIDVMSINFNQIQAKDEIKERLHRMIDEIID